MNNEIEREITALREQLAAVSKERDEYLNALKAITGKTFIAATKEQGK